MMFVYRKGHAPLHLPTRSGKARCGAKVNHSTTVQMGREVCRDCLKGGK